MRNVYEVLAGKEGTSRKTYRKWEIRILRIRCGYCSCGEAMYLRVPRSEGNVTTTHSCRLMKRFSAPRRLTSVHCFVAMVTNDRGHYRRKEEIHLKQTDASVLSWMICIIALTQGCTDCDPRDGTGYWRGRF
jgi:hypothetical protein